MDDSHISLCTFDSIDLSTVCMLFYVRKSFEISSDLKYSKSSINFPPDLITKTKLSDNVNVEKETAFTTSTNNNSFNIPPSLPFKQLSLPPTNYSNSFNSPPKNGNTIINDTNNSKTLVNINKLDGDDFFFNEELGKEKKEGDYSDNIFYKKKREREIGFHNNNIHEVNEQNKSDENDGLSNVDFF
jgi:hypothetical protein